MDPLIERIRTEKERPLVGVIGATLPTKGYEKTTGQETGYELRTYLEENPGTIFTGGVSGVGVDVYEGIEKFCKENTQYVRRPKTLWRKKIAIPEDRFFVLVPGFYYDIPRGLEEIMDDNSIQQYKRLYEPPSAYEISARSSARGTLDVVVAGHDMSERRKYLAAVADAIIVLNGGYGTLDEAFTALESSAPVIAMDYTGGAANILSSIRKGEIDEQLKKSLERQDFHVSEINPELIYIVRSTEEMTRELYRILH